MKLWRTFRDVIIKPNKVILDGNDLYLNPLSFALSLMGPITLLNFWIKKTTVYDYADATPDYYQNYLQFVDDFTSNFASVRELIALSVPLFLILSLLFLERPYKRSIHISWRFTLYIGSIGSVFHYILYISFEGSGASYIWLTASFMPYIFYAVYKIYGLSIMSTVKVLIGFLFVHFSLRFFTLAMFWSIHNHLLFAEGLQERHEPILKPSKVIKVDEGPWIPGALHTKSGTSHILSNQGEGWLYKLKNDQLAKHQQVNVDGSYYWTFQNDSLFLVSKRDEYISIEVYNNDDLVLRDRIKSNIISIHDIGWNGKLFISGNEEESNGIWTWKPGSDEIRMIINSNFSEGKFRDVHLLVDSTNTWMCTTYDAGEGLMTERILHKFMIKNDSISDLESVEIFNAKNGNPTDGIGVIYYDNDTQTVYFSYPQAEKIKYKIHTDAWSLESFKKVFSTSKAIAADEWVVVNDIVKTNDELILCGFRVLLLQEKWYPFLTLEGWLMKINLLKPKKYKLYRAGNKFYEETIYYQMLVQDNSLYMIVQERIKSRTYNGPIGIPYENNVYKLDLGSKNEPQSQLVF